MAEFRTLHELYAKSGAEYLHPLGKLSIVGSVVEAFPIGSYMYMTTQCPTVNAGPGYQVAMGWYINEGRPPKVGAKVPWLCGCVRAEPVQAEVNTTLIIRENEPAILDGKRGLLWPESFKTVLIEDIFDIKSVF